MVLGVVNLPVCTPGQKFIEFLSVSCTTPSKSNFWDFFNEQSSQIIFFKYVTYNIFGFSGHGLDARKQ